MLPSTGARGVANLELVSGTDLRDSALRARRDRFEVHCSDDALRGGDDPFDRGGESLLEGAKEGRG